MTPLDFWKLYRAPILAVAGLVLFVVLIVWIAVLRHGAHSTKEAVKAVTHEVQTTTQVVQAQEKAAVEDLNRQVAVSINRTKQRAKKHVERIEAAAAADPEYNPDLDFYRGVCDTAVYASDPLCRRLGLAASRPGS